MSHRVPPKPPWFSDPGKGHCRWCGKPVTSNRLCWHNKCLIEYKKLFWPAVIRRLMFEEAAGTCQGCGKLLASRCLLDGLRLTEEISIPHRHVKSKRYHLDHIIPLADFPHDPQDPYAAWREPNLQILCEDCHKAKTAQEATRRAERRRDQQAEDLPLMKLMQEET